MTTNYLEQTFQSLDEIQHWVLASLLKHGEQAKPRGINTLELWTVNFTLLNPRRRCVENSQRRWSLPLAIGEFCWHVSGSNELQFIEYYAPVWREFTDDGATIRGSCYGHRIFKAEAGLPSQWERIVQLLRVDPHSRRAVLHFSEPSIGLDVNSKDVPCASTLQFVIRQGRVNAITHMRSNDAIWGLPYDIFLFTMLQELLACELEIEIGTYSHSVASLHLYERHFDLAGRILEQGIAESTEMLSMKEHHQLPQFLKTEAKLRSGKLNGLSEDVEKLNNYWRSLIAVLEKYRSKKHATAAQYA